MTIYKVPYCGGSHYKGAKQHSNMLQLQMLVLCNY